MQYFVKRLLGEEGFSCEFFFNRIYTVKGTGYHVSVRDKKSQSYFFNMEQTSSGWRIVNAPKLPEWILDAEKKLEEAIFESLLQE